MNGPKHSEASMTGVVLSGLKSDKSVKRLEQISTLRARGLSKDIDLPQLVVCGDQSAGKSSVLEGLSHIPFPRDEGVCTKFPTEVILEHSEEATAITATIIPHTSRSDALKSKLHAFSRSIGDFTELPKVIAEAAAVMGIRGYGGNKAGPAFVEDVLRIKVVGQTGLHLSIVDLPGLISVASEEQTESDVSTVHRMNDSYIERPRTIILAVVQASNGIANQRIIKKSKQFDKAGRRTVGIITKPDLINKGSEGRTAALAKNQDTTKLQLGFFLLKNPTPAELKDKVTPEQRSMNELHFFQSSPWRAQTLDTIRVGIEKLRDYLQKLLDQHIEKELPKVRDEIKSMIKTAKNEILSLPSERPTVGHLRMFLSDLAMRYHSLALAAVNGDYHTSNAAFFAFDDDQEGSTRLRALVHSMNTTFADCMREKGKTLKVGQSQSRDVAASTVPSECNTTSPGGDDGSFDRAIDAATKASKFGPKHVTEPYMKAWVKKVSLLGETGRPQPANAYIEDIIKTRGRELPGNYNSVLLTELFHHQSMKWPAIAFDHLENVCKAINEFVKKAVDYLGVEDHVSTGIRELVDTRLQDSKSSAKSELDKLCADEHHQPITYNRYITDNVQKSRRDSVQELIKGALDRIDNADGGNKSSTMTSAALVGALQNEVIVDMDEQARSEALAGLNAYYKVALKTFVDNDCRQVVERHLLRKLPDIFSPQTVAGYPDEELERIAGEKQDVMEKRKYLQEQLKNLKEGLNDLRK